MLAVHPFCTKEPRDAAACLGLVSGFTLCTGGRRSSAFCPGGDLLRESAQWFNTQSVRRLLLVPISSEDACF